MVILVLDGLVVAGCLENDGQKQIKEFGAKFLQADCDGVNIEIIEI